MYALYNLAHCGYWFSSAMNYVVGSVVSYFLNKHFTFRSATRSWREVLRFAVNIAACWFAAYVLALPLAQAIFDMLSDTARDNIAMLFGMVIFTGLNYLGQRFFAFKYSDQPPRTSAPPRSTPTTPSASASQRRRRSA